MQRKTQRAAPSVRQNKLKSEADQIGKDFLHQLNVASLNDLITKISDYKIPSEFTQTTYKRKIDNDKD